MTGTKIDGNAIAKDIHNRLKAEIQAAQASNPRFKPSLVIFQGQIEFTNEEWLRHADKKILEVGSRLDSSKDAPCLFFSFIGRG
jgi:5,10-methylene-tetrahydrofolate dehydrogenase/methenyl tetrahydrofolate cyclohydrolase